MAEEHLERAAEPPKKAPEVWQRTDAGCMFLAVLVIAICSAAGGIFKVAVDGGAAWAGALAVAALSGMGVGIAHVVTRKSP
jgi:hypothetical protein